MNPAIPNYRHSPAIVVAFGVTVAMWIVGFIGRLPSIQLQGPVLFFGLVVCMGMGGILLGRVTVSPLGQGVKAGALVALLNMLVLGSLLTSEADQGASIPPKAIWWIPGFILVAVAVMTLAAFIGRMSHRPRAIDWTARFTWVTATLTFFLLLVGGLVTSHDAGLAVPDWPNSYGYNMFLFPLSKMVGGIYYEHTHRLFGSLVGLTILVMTVHLWVVNRRRDLKWLSLGILGLVIVQGILGGLRVTGKITSEVDASAMEPNIYLAVTHGVLGQVVFIGMIALVVMTSRVWQERLATDDPSIDRFFTTSLIGLLLVQLIAGAVVRHLHTGYEVHITGGVLAVMLAIACGVRAWGKYGPHSSVFHRIGIALMSLVSLQFVLGLLAFVFSVRDNKVEVRPTSDLFFTSVHQAIGAVLLAVAFCLALITRRVLVESAEGDENDASEATWSESSSRATLSSS